MSEEPEVRWIVLGASNVANLFPSLLQWSLSTTTCRHSYLLACGHGRSYRHESHFVWRELPGILDCRLWPYLAQLPPADHPLALVTDIGNDLVFGALPQAIVTSITQAVTRLRQAGVPTVVTGLPVESIRAARRWQFEFLRRIVFPRTDLTYPLALARATELHDRLQAWITSANDPGLHFVEPQREWYGWDPIHIQRSQGPQAWLHYFRPLLNEAWHPSAAGGAPLAEIMAVAERLQGASRLSRWPTLRKASWVLAAAAERQLCGWKLTTHQPVRSWHNRHTLAMF